MNTRTRRLLIAALAMAALGMSYLMLQRHPVDAEAQGLAQRSAAVIELPKVQVTARRERLAEMGMADGAMQKSLPVIHLPQVNVVARRADLLLDVELPPVGLAQDLSETQEPG